MGIWARMNDLPEVKMEMVLVNYCDYYELDILIYYEIKNSDKQNTP